MTAIHNPSWRHGPLPLAALLCAALFVSTACGGGGGSQTPDGDTDVLPDGEADETIPEEDVPTEEDTLDPDPDVADGDILDPDPDTVDGDILDPDPDDDEAPPDPCDPNPCTLVHGRTVCSVDGGQAVCSCEPDFFEDDGQGGCRTLVVDEAALPDLAAPIEAMPVVVTDPAGQPVVGATVEVAGRNPLFTDAQGRAIVPDLPGDQDVRLSVAAPGFAPVNRLLDHMGLGSAPVAVVLPPLEPAPLFPAGGGATVGTGNGQLTFPPGGIAQADGRPYLGEVQVRIAVADLDGGASVPGNGQLVDGQGNAQPFEPAGLFYAGMATPDGSASLGVAQGAAVTVSVRLPGSLQPSTSEGATNPNQAAVGETMALASLDEATGSWRMEGKKRKKK